MIEMRKVKLDKKSRLSLALVKIMLFINSFNLILDKIIQIFVSVETYFFNKTTSVVFDYYS